MNNSNKYNNKFQQKNNNKYNNKYQKNNKYSNNKYHNGNKSYNNYNTQAQPIKISSTNCLELNNFMNDIVEIYLVKNMKIIGKLVSYDLDNLDCVLEDSTLYILKDLQTLSEEEEIQIAKLRESMENPYDDIIDDEINYGLAMIKGINIVSFSKVD
ncbi:hypothetical protein FOG50_01750 [Hanseniaspora uvarum]|jgi:small nuclear ribonucleoprotein (snRNP)-like protein|nr:hypothetical protein FOG50_01750 [Hanseniaspora uvarum]